MIISIEIHIKYTIILLLLIFNLDIYFIINNNITNKFVYSYAYICVEYNKKKLGKLNE